MFVDGRQSAASAEVNAPTLAALADYRGLTPRILILLVVVRIWLSRYGLSQSRRPVKVEAAANEWTIPQIVDRYQIPVSTVHGWVRRRQVPARQIGGVRGRWILRATLAELDALVNNRRTSSNSADQENGNQANATKKPVSRGVV
jgi:hypothetical protein